MMILYLILFATLGVALDLGNLEFLFWIFYGITFITSLMVEMSEPLEEFINKLKENDKKNN